MYGFILLYYEFSLRSLILVLFGTVGGTYFHGAMILAPLIMLIILLVLNTKKVFLRLVTRAKIKKSVFYFLIGCLVIIFAFWHLIEFIPKVSLLKKTDLTWIISQLKGRSSESISSINAAYPASILPNNIIELFVLLPIRVLYFFMSPFPWDVKSTKHLLGLFDSCVIQVLFLMIIINFKRILTDPLTIALLIFLLSYGVVFSLGVDNFGTGLRHRTKFVFLIMLLSVPYFMGFRPTDSKLLKQKESSNFAT